ncbi:MAG: glycosyltransferase [Saprospiraceae bacterium]
MKATKTGTDKPVLCYIGDLPDQRIDGITTSFQRNLDILSRHYNIINTPENSRLDRSVFIRIITVFNFWKRTKIFLSRKKTDICYFNLPVSTLGVIKVLFLLICIKKVSQYSVLHIHRGDFNKEIQNSTLFRNLVKRIFEKADGIIVLSKTEAALLNETMKSKKVKYLANSIHVPESSLIKYVNGKNLLYISNYLESKGIFDLLEVLKDLKSEAISLDCYGHFPDDKMKYKVVAYHSESIKINGPIVGDDKFIAMNKAIGIILPSWSEGQPLVILEAMSQGLPIIASDVGFVKEMLGDDYPFLIEPRNKTALKNAIIKLSNSKDLDIIGKGLKDRFDIYFSPEIHEKKLLKIFEPFIN